MTGSKYYRYIKFCCQVLAKIMLTFHLLVKDSFCNASCYKILKEQIM